MPTQAGKDIFGISLILMNKHGIGHRKAVAIFVSKLINEATCFLKHLSNLFSEDIPTCRIIQYFI